MENQEKMTKPTTIALFILIIAGLAFIIAGPLVGQYKATGVFITPSTEGGGTGSTIVTTSTIIPCEIELARVLPCDVDGLPCHHWEHECIDQGLPCIAEPGDTLNFEVYATGPECPTETGDTLWAYLYGYAWDSTSTCRIKHGATHASEMEGIYGQAMHMGQAWYDHHHVEKYEGTWTVPTVAASCNGKEVPATSAYIYESEWTNKYDAAYKSNDDEVQGSVGFDVECTADFAQPDPNCPSNKPICLGNICEECHPELHPCETGSCIFVPGGHPLNWKCKMCGNGRIEALEPYVEECEADNDCGENGRCLTCKCYTACSDNSDCPEGEWCRFDDRVTGLCSRTEGYTWNDEFGAFKVLKDPGTGTCTASGYTITSDDCNEDSCYFSRLGDDGESCTCEFDPNCNPQDPAPVDNYLTCDYPDPYGVGKNYVFSTKQAYRFDAIVLTNINAPVPHWIVKNNVIQAGHHNKHWVIHHEDDPTGWYYLFFLLSPPGTTDDDLYGGADHIWNSPHVVKTCNSIHFAL